jgi:hypothetical protein
MLINKPQLSKSSPGIEKSSLKVVSIQESLNSGDSKTDVEGSKIPNMEFVLRLVLMHNEGIRVVREMVKIIQKTKNPMYFF